MIETPIQGKTFSLFGGSDSTDGYYRTVAVLAEVCLDRCPDIHELLAAVRHASRRRFWPRGRGRRRVHSLPEWLATAADATLSAYASGVAAHLAGLTLRQRFDRTLATTQLQYHLLMLEIELTNRAFAEAFRRSARRIALLPHCLHDLERDCRAEPDGLDYVCKGCSKVCGINAVSRRLREQGIEAYVWMQANLRSLLARAAAREGSVGVFGVACVPELAAGLRRCTRGGVPAVGVPLNANRCGRWMGQFHPTSVSLAEIEAFVA